MNIGNSIRFKDAEIRRMCLERAYERERAVNGLPASVSILEFQAMVTQYPAEPLPDVVFTLERT